MELGGDITASEHTGFRCCKDPVYLFPDSCFINSFGIDNADLIKGISIADAQIFLFEVAQDNVITQSMRSFDKFYLVRPAA